MRKGCEAGMTEREKVIGLLKETAEYFRECRSNASFASKAENHFWELQNAANEVVNLLKEQEAVEPYMDYDGHDVWRCGNCGATIFHIEQSQADEDWKNYAKFCRQCGKKVKWE